ncbi:MAG TPA: hypothetical protein VFA26_01020 [Gemmataceae bacterium]|nr:hypothetical protein [Gemmataceae bacterium]
MSPETLNCNQCGAELHVPPTTNYVACMRCGARLAVRRQGDAAYTEPVGQDQGPPEPVADQLAEIRYQNEIARIDREWQMEREQYLIRGRYGSYVPSPGGSVLGGMVVVVFGIIWTMMAVSMGAPLFFPLFGLVFIFLGIGVSLWSHSKAVSYREAFERYRRRRASVRPENFRTPRPAPPDENIREARGPAPRQSPADGRFRAAE